MTLHEHETQPVYWEPGRPFQVGDRVRIRLSGECTAPIFCRLCNTEAGHLAGIDNALARIDQYDHDADYGHHYIVRFLRHVPIVCPGCGGASATRAQFAAAELELIKAASS